jgi:hypothetical protein
MPLGDMEVTWGRFPCHLRDDPSSGIATMSYENFLRTLPNIDYFEGFDSYTLTYCVLITGE